MSGIPIRLQNDDRLVRLAAAGDRSAFGSIYSRHHQGLYRYCRSIVGNDEDAADALQSTMARAMQALEGERRDLELKPWLYRIAHNESISLLRRRRPHAAIEAAEGSEATTGPALEGAAESRERLRQLVSDLASLPERQRGALLMRELSGLSYPDVAAALGISAGAAKQTVFEARSALHELSEGRDMPCESVRRSISDRDGRVLRGRRMRAHLRDCAGCRDFRDAIGARGADLQALFPPLPAATAAGLLERLTGGGGDGPAGGLGIPEAGAEAALGAAAAGSGAAGSGGWIAGALGASAAAKGVAAVAATLAVGTGVAGIAASSGDRQRPAAEAAGQEAGGPVAADGLDGDEDPGGGEQTAPGAERDGRDRRERDDRDPGERGESDDERDSGAGPPGGVPSPGGSPPAGRDAPRGGPPASEEGGDGPRPGADAPDGAGPPSGGGLPEPAEQNAGADIPEQGTGAPGSQAPTGSPGAGAPVPSLPDRGATAAPDAGPPALPDLVPETGAPAGP